MGPGGKVLVVEKCQTIEARDEENGATEVARTIQFYGATVSRL